MLMCKRLVLVFSVPVMNPDEGLTFQLIETWASFLSATAKANIYYILLTLVR